MAVRNCKEFGDNLVDIAKRLLSNQNLCKYLLYTDANPLKHDDIINTKDLLHKEVRLVPKITPQEDTTSTIVLLINKGSKNTSNAEFKTLNLLIYVYVPFETWIINDSQLRPFAIMSEIQSSLDYKQVKGLGRLVFQEFSTDLLTDEMGAYRMNFKLEVFN
jgi:hypothetical protein